VEADPCASEGGRERDPHSRVARALLSDDLGARLTRCDDEAVVDLDGRDLDDCLGDGLDGVVEVEAGEVHSPSGPPLVEGGKENAALEDEAGTVG